MKNWTEYTDKDGEHLYNGSFDLKAELNCNKPARDVPEMTPSADSQQVRELSEQLQKMTAAFEQSQAELQEQKNIYKKFQSAEERHREVLNKTHEELKQQVQANDDLNKEVMRQKRDKELYQMRLNDVEKTLKFQGQNNQHFKKATERKLTETIKRLEVEIRKVKEASKIELDETKQVLHNTQEELKQQVQANEGLKKDINREKGEKEIFQIRNSHLEKHLKIQRQNVEAAERNLTETISGLEEEIKKEKDAMEAELVETKQVLLKTQEDLKQQIKANKALETQRNELAGCLNEMLQMVDELEEGIRKENQEKNDIQAELEKALEQTAALQSQLNKERANFENESNKDKEAYYVVVKEKEELLERIQQYSNSIESQQNQVQELSAALLKVEVEKENLASALKTTEELREQTGAALEQLVQLYDKKMSKRRFWRRP